MLNVAGRQQFCNSNDVNQLRKTARPEPKTGSTKKSFQTLGRDRGDLHSHKAKKYTQSYDSNQFNFKFKRRRKADEPSGREAKASHKKIRVLHEGRRG